MFKKTHLSRDCARLGGNKANISKVGRLIMPTTAT